MSISGPISTPFCAIVVAAGTGSRAGGDKQWRRLRGKPVLRWSVEALVAAGAVTVLVVGPEGGEARAAEALDGLEGWRFTVGGETRAASVEKGLAALPAEAPEVVLIHDAARPLLPPAVIVRVIEALQTADAALPALPVDDSLRRGHEGNMGEVVLRDDLWRAQTPQAFRRGQLTQAYAAWTGDVPTDDAAVARASGLSVALVAGDPRLAKLTRPEDFSMLEAMMPMQTRIGSGFDAHRWGPGGSVWLCGVEIPHDQTLIGHSDADAGLHALTDALLGAIGAGDIGDHFPPTDPKWKGASSDRFLEHAAALIAERGGRIINVDVTLICERPKVKPHREAMRQRIADILALPLDAVSVKATTTEGMGFPGRGEGLAAQAVASVELPAA